MNLILSVTKNEDGTHSVSWEANAETKLHTVLLRVWFGKRKSRNVIYYPFAKFVHTDFPHEVLTVSGTEFITPENFSQSWQQANYEGYVCQFNSIDSPADQYQCKDSAVVSVTKK